MRNLIAAAFMAFASACAARPDAPLAAPAPAAPPPDTSFSWHRTGEGTYIYHRVWGNCTTLGHGHGRNMAWGRWEMPLAEIIDGGAEEAGEGGALVRFTCRDGSACMRKGALLTATEPVSEHKVPFGTMTLARQFTEAVVALKTACQLPN